QHGQPSTASPARPAQHGQPSTASPARPAQHGQRPPPHARVRPVLAAGFQPTDFFWREGGGRA
ncbi:hypothetical protein, partial [Hymenobacter montanus]|uniref:hypothetical protein n=1 Tax=Hymenobacter montanus TaxID=2771359 RepID=UPI001CC298B6